MPYNYVIEAFYRGTDLYREQLRDIEKPIALNTSIFANSQRDTKKQRKAFSYEDFAFYLNRKDKNLPDGHYGTAALKLQEAGRYPSWALFCFKELISGASLSYVPNVLALTCEDALILDPQFKENAVTGFLVIMESASLQMRTFTDDKGQQYDILMPEVDTKIIAQEDITLLLKHPQQAKAD